MSDDVASVIDNIIALEPNPIPRGYSKIATMTVKAGKDGVLPSRVVINADDNGKAFRIGDFFLKMKLAHTIDGATTGKLIVRGVVDDGSDIRCSSGYCQLSNLSSNSLNQYYARFITYERGGGGLLMVSKDSFGTGFQYGTSPNYSGESTYMCPTEPDVSLEDGMNAIHVIMAGADWGETPFADGCTFELWGVRV